VTRKLPPAAAFSHAVSSIANNVRVAFRIGWPWYAIVLPVTLTIYALLTAASGGDPETKPVLAFFANLLIATIAMISASSIAVNWHRYILRDEVPQGSEVLRLDDLVWRYFGNMLTIMLVIVAVLLIIAVPLSFIAALVNVPALGIAATFILGIPIAGTLFLRIAIKLPAIALGRTDFSWRDAWQASDGNNAAIFTLFVLNLLVAAGAIVAVVVTHALFSLFGAVIGGIIEITMQVIINWILTIFGITILTSLYGFFIENRDF
jgi:hypothetical protein